MMKNFARASLVAMLVCASASVVPFISSASAGDKVSAAVGKPLVDAEKLIQSGDYKGALEKVQEAQGVTDRKPFDDYTINQLLLQIYIKTNDYASATTAVEAMADSPAMPDSDKPGTLHNACLLSSQAKHYQKAISYCAQLGTLNALDDQTTAVLAEDYYFVNDFPHAEQYAQQSVDRSKAEGQPPNESALQIVMSSQVKQNNQGAAEQTLEQLALAYNQPDSWSQLIDVALGTHGIKDTDVLYLYRLRVVIGAMTHSDDYTTLGSLAEQLGYPAEAVSVLQQGISSGKISEGQVSQVLGKARRDAAGDERALPSIAASAERSKSGEQDVKLGEDYWGYGRYADAETAAQHAIAKGGLKDPSEGPLLLGAAQVAQGKYDDGVQSLSQVNGSEAQKKVAHLWSLYAQAKKKQAQGPATTAPSAAPAAQSTTTQ